MALVRRSLADDAHPLTRNLANSAHGRRETRSYSPAMAAIPSDRGRLGFDHLEQFLFSKDLRQLSLRVGHPPCVDRRLDKHLSGVARQCAISIGVGQRPHQRERPGQRHDLVAAFEGIGRGNVRDQFIRDSPGSCPSIGIAPFLAKRIARMSSRLRHCTIPMLITDRGGVRRDFFGKLVLNDRYPGS